jgi:WD40 repeat protein
VEGYVGGQIIDLEGKRIVGRVSGGNGPSFGYAFSNDDKYMAYTAADRTTGGPYYSIDLLDLSTGAPAFSGYDFFLTELSGRYHTMSAPAISPDTKLVAAGHSDKRVYVWDLHTGKTRFTLEGHGSNVTCVDFNPNGKVLASGSLDGTVRLWNPSTGELIRVITGFMNDINDLQFTADGQSLRVWIADQTEVVVDLHSYEINQAPSVTPTLDTFELQQFQQGFSSRTSSVFSEILFSPDGNLLALASQNILIWDMESKKLESFLDNSSGGTIRGMVFNADGSQMAASTNDDQVIVWETSTGRKLFSWSSNFLSGMTVFYGVGDSELGPARGRGPIAEQGLAFSPGGDLLAFGDGSTIAIRDLGGSGKITTLINQTGRFATQVSFSQDGKRLYAILNRNRIAQIWDVASGQLIKEVALSDVDPNAFSAIALRGPLFARNNSDAQKNGWIELWNLEDGKYITFPVPSSQNEPMVFSPDGSLLVSENEGQLFFWDTQTGGLIYQTGLKFNPGGFSISKDNQSIAIGNEGKATILDIRPLLQLPRQSSPASIIPQSTPTPFILSWPTSTPIPTSKPSIADIQTKAITRGNALSVVEKRRFSRGTIDHVLWSPAGNSIFLSGSLGVSEYNVDANVKRFTSIFHQETEHWMYKTVVLPNGKILATGTDAGRVYVMDVDSGRVLVDQEGIGEPALSPDGSMVVYLNPDGILTVWDIEQEKQVITLGSDWYAPLHPIFSPDGQWIAAVQSTGSNVRYDDSIRVWSVKTGEIVNALAGPDNNIMGMNFSMDGKYLVAAAGGSAWVWSMVPGDSPEKLELYPVEINDNLNTYSNTVTAAALSPDNSILAVGTSEHTLLLYDRSTQKKSHDLNGHAGSIRQLSFSPDGRLLISADQDGKLILWDVDSGNYLAELTEHSGPIEGLVYQQDTKLTAWGKGTAWTLNPVSGQLLHTTRIGSGEILSASPLGDFLAVYSLYTVSLWDAQKGTFLQKLEGEAEEPFVEYYWEGLVFRRFYEAAFSLDGSHLVTAGSGGIWYYDLGQRRLIQQFQGSNAQKVVFGPDNRSIITSLYEQANPASVFDMQSGKMVFSLGEIYGRGSDYIQSAFSPNGQWIGTLRSVWDEPYKLEVYDFTIKQFDRSLSLEKDIPPVSLAFSPSGDLVAIGFANGDIQLVDWKEQQVLTTLKGHHEAVTHVLFSADGRNVISGGVDGTVRTWGLP